MYILQIFVSDASHTQNNGVTHSLSIEYLIMPPFIFINIYYGLGGKAGAEVELAEETICNCMWEATTGLSTFKTAKA
jgi:hypothetical protein